MTWSGWTRVKLDRHRVENLTRYSLAFELDVLVKTWLLNHAGIQHSYFQHEGSWHHDIPMAAQDVTFYFRDPKIAVLFKLVWS